MLDSCLEIHWLVGAFVSASSEIPFPPVGVCLRLLTRVNAFLLTSLEPEHFPRSSVTTPLCSPIWSLNIFPGVCSQYDSLGIAFQYILHRPQPNADQQTTCAQINTARAAHQPPNVTLPSTLARVHAVGLRLGCLSVSAGFGPPGQGASRERPANLQ